MEKLNKIIVIHPVLEYLNSRPLISYNRFKTTYGLSTTQICNAMKGKIELNSRHINTLEEVLKDYGYEKS